MNAETGGLARFTSQADQRPAIKGSEVHSLSRAAAFRMKPSRSLSFTFFLLIPLLVVDGVQVNSRFSFFLSVVKKLFPPGLFQQSEDQSWTSHLPLLLHFGFWGMNIILPMIMISGITWCMLLPPPPVDPSPLFIIRMETLKEFYGTTALVGWEPLFSSVLKIGRVSFHWGFSVV